MSYSLVMSPLLRPLAGTQKVAGLLSPEADIAAMLRFEVALAGAQESAREVPKGTAARVKKAASKINIDPESFAEAIARDGMVVPELVMRLKAALPKAARAHVHVNSTSQDVIDTSLMVRARDAMSVLRGDLRQAQRQLVLLDRKFGRKPLMARTRMQRALPVTVSDRLALWRSGLAAADKAMRALAFPLQCSGPVGTFNPAYKKALARALGLACLDRSWQAERSHVLAIGNACAATSGALGKIGTDIALMAQNEIAEIKLKGGGTSSAMHHKHNPVKAEVLVTLARFSAAQVSGLHQAAVHEQERSGAAWTLEWLVLPQLICAAAASAHLVVDLLQSIESIGA